MFSIVFTYRRIIPKSRIHSTYRDISAVPAQNFEYQFFSSLVLILSSLIQNFQLVESKPGYIEGDHYKEASVLTPGQKTGINLFSGQGSAQMLLNNNHPRRILSAIAAKFTGHANKVWKT